MIPYGRQEVTADDIDSVVKTLKSDFLTQGTQTILFERSIANYCNASYGTSTNSATSALHISCMALDLNKDDLVWTSPISFVASANCALYCGAEIDFVDIDSESYNINTLRLREKLELGKIKGRLPKILIAVHLAGQSCNMSEIHALSIEFGFKIIEDASHALGGLYKDTKIGSCKYSDITVLSFHPVKIITTGEGGMALTNSSELDNKLKLLRTHGIIKDTSKMTDNPHGSWYYEQVLLGYNYRMSDIQAALGLSQLARLDEYIEIRNKIANFYTEQLKDLPAIVPIVSKECRSSYHLYILRIKTGQTKNSHKEIFELLRNCGIGVNLHYIPIYRQPYYARYGYNPNDFPESEQYYKEAISIPIFPSLKAEELNFVVNTLKRIIN